MTRILITRPWEDAQPLAQRLLKLGHQVLVEPMLEISFFEGPAPNLKQIQGFLFTSANGVRAISRLTDCRKLPVFAVGDATAAAARAAGFSTVTSASGDVTALARLVTTRCDPAAGPLLHVAASVRAGDLSGMLERAGFTVDRQILYAGRPATALAPATQAALSSGGIDVVLLFSPRTAQALGELLNMAGLGAVCAGVAAVCLSPAVAEAAAAIPWRTVRVAARPEQDALLAVLADCPGAG